MLFAVGLLYVSLNTIVHRITDVEYKNRSAAFGWDLIGFLFKSTLYKSCAVEDLRCKHSAEISEAPVVGWEGRNTTGLCGSLISRWYETFLKCVSGNSDRWSLLAVVQFDFHGNFLYIGFSDSNKILFAGDLLVLYVVEWNVTLIYRLCLVKISINMLS